MARCRAALFVLVVIATATSGCAAAGLAAGPLMSAVQAISDRAVERTVLADLGTASAAVEAVFARSAIVVQERRRDGDTIQLRGAGPRLSVHASLEPATASMTRVSMRVETGGLLADRQTAEQLQSQLALALAPPAGGEVAGSDAAQREALATLQDEVRKLRSTVEEKRPPAGVASRPAEASAERAGPPFTVNQRGIVSVPESYGLATSWRSGATAGAVPAARPEVAGGPAGVPPRRADIEPPTRAAAGVEPLSPAGLLTPVAPVAGATRVD